MALSVRLIEPIWLILSVVESKWPVSTADLSAKTTLSILPRIVESKWPVSEVDLSAKVNFVGLIENCRVKMACQ